MSDCYYLSPCLTLLFLCLLLFVSLSVILSSCLYVSYSLCLRLLFLSLRLLFVYLSVLFSLFVINCLSVILSVSLSVTLCLSVILCISVSLPGPDAIPNWTSAPQLLFLFTGLSCSLPGNPGSEVGGGRPSSAGPCQAVSTYLSSNRPALTLATS